MLSSFPYLAQASIMTVFLSVASIAIGLVLGLLSAVVRVARVPVADPIARVYISVIRGTPLLVQLYIIFFALPSIGVVIDPFPTAVIAFSLNVGGYAAEAIRGSILSIPRGQWEAATTVGLGYALTLRRVILPQAMRVAVPPLSNTFISLVKDTSLASTVMVTELLRRAQEIAAPSYQFMALYSLAAVIYWLICSVLSVAQQRLERRLGRYVTS